MSVALLFPGQGVQHEGMLPWLDEAPAAAPVLARLQRAIGPDWRQSLSNAEWSERNRVAQPLITAVNLAAWQVLQQAGLPGPLACAGYSVGELSAYSAAGVFAVDTAQALAEARARAMDESAARHPGSLVAVSGVLAGPIDSACTRWPVQVAIRIAPDRCLLGGDPAALAAATAWLADQGADISHLRIRVASHTSHMTAAATTFAALIDPMAWSRPGRLLVTNREGQAVRSVSEAKRCLAEQIDHAVQWQACMQTLAERRPSCVLEVGPGTSLSRFWRAAQPGIPARSLEDFADPAGAVEWVVSQA